MNTNLHDMILNVILLDASVSPREKKWNKKQQIKLWQVDLSLTLRLKFVINYKEKQQFS